MSTPVYKQIISALDAHGCKYEIQHHEPTHTSEIAVRVRGVSLHEGAKAIGVSWTGNQATTSGIIMSKELVLLLRGAIETKIKTTD